MISETRRRLTMAAATVLPLAFVALAWPANGHAAECGPGTIFDPPTNLCVLPPAPPEPPPAPPPPPPPPPPPMWSGDITPGFSVGICAPIPFVSLCTGI